MQDDAIRAALDAAVLSYDAARVAAHGGTLDLHGMSATNRMHITPLIAAAIGQFLLRLGTDNPAIEGGRLHSVTTGWMRLPDLAAAVERAAQEEQR